MTGSVRCRAVEVGDTDGQGLSATLEVRSYRSAQDTELIFVRRLYTDDRIAAEHIRTNVQSCTAAVRRYESIVGLNRIGNSSTKRSLGKMGISSLAAEDSRRSPFKSGRKVTICPSSVV